VRFGNLFARTLTLIPSCAVGTAIPWTLLSPCLQDALSWCLLVQELLMWQPWQDVVLNYPGMGEVRDAAGNVVFRGPR
jgi:hypothetical protein